MKVIHYINQFFAGIGGEDKADQEPFIKAELIGPSQALGTMLQGAEVTHTIVCGDNFMGSNTDEAVTRILAMLEDKEFDLFVAGPAFQAGRYGFACGTICKAVRDRFHVPVFTSMHVENPGVEMFKKEMPIFIGGKSAAKMRADVQVMGNYINKVIAGQPTLGAAAEGYFARGIRHQVWPEGMKPAARRGVEMLIQKLNGQPWETELVIPAKDLVPIAPAIQDLTKARIALVTTGGIVPIENPDRIQSASATRWGRYDMTGMDRLEGGVFKTIHAGFDPAAANADPNVIVPLDAMRAYEKEGKYGALHPYFYSTVGTGTTEAEARRMAQEIIPLLQQDGVNAVIMGSTWGTCTRCGATMVKEFERAGFVVVQMCNLIPVAMTVGANRMVPTISIPYPLGDPNTSKEEQWKLRYHRVGVALDALTVDVSEQTVFKTKF